MINDQETLNLLFDNLSRLACEPPPFHLSCGV